jgi:hypothetical protein
MENQNPELIKEKDEKIDLLKLEIQQIQIAQQALQQEFYKSNKDIINQQKLSNNLELFRLEFQQKKSRNKTRNSDRIS